MKRAQLFTKTSKTIAKDADSVNAKLLIQAGFINQEMAGVYSYLPLGLRVLNNIENIVRQEMDLIDGQEILMSSLSSKQIWETTDRWKGFDALFKVPASGDKEYGLNPTHEEVVTPIAAKHIQSYKDFPFAIYQIQTKFRNEARAKSGLLRGREFRMKDLYSFHTSEEDFEEYYTESIAAYMRVFERVGLGDITHKTFAPGGAFTDKMTHEFQTINEWGEDTVYICKKCGVGHNAEIYTDGMKCMECGATDFTKEATTEVGNIFPLGTKYTEAFGYTYTDEDGKTQPIIMGCYGIGTSRLMGTVAEVLSDDNGLVWPEEVAPYAVNIIPVGKSDAPMKAAEKLYSTLLEQGVEVMMDDRDTSPGEKFADNDLIGIPYRVVISEKTLEKNQIEFKERTKEDVEMLDEAALLKKFS